MKFDNGNSPSREVLRNPLFMIEKEGQDVTVFFEGVYLAEFRGVDVLYYENGILLYPTTHLNQNNAYRRYCFINNNGEKLFNFDKKIDKQTRASLENIDISVGSELVTVTRTSLSGDVVKKVYNIETCAKKTFADDGQLSIFDV